MTKHTDNPILLCKHDASTIDAVPRRKYSVAFDNISNSAFQAFDQTVIQEIVFNLAQRPTATKPKQKISSRASIVSFCTALV